MNGKKKNTRAWKGMEKMKEYKLNFAGRAVCLSIVCGMAVTFLAGCGNGARKGYTREELDNLARLELYEAGSDMLLQTIEDEETLYRYCQARAASEDAYEYEAEESLKETAESAETAGTTESAETAESAGASYYLAVYQYPAAKFGDKTPKKIYTITLYQDTNIAKMVVEDEVIKMITLPEEFLTFYYKMSDTEREFYESLLEKDSGDEQ